MQSHTIRRLFSTTPIHYAHRALVYGGKGEPSAVIRAVSFPTLAPPPPKGLNIRVLAAPVNPADVNVIQGVYPDKPSPAIPEIQSAAGAKGDDKVYVGGNEGIAEVVSVGSAVQGVSKGDWGEHISNKNYDLV
jgi:NADPH:quinone reductase-like Zn-dependent oxidoreductase